MDPRIEPPQRAQAIDRLDPEACHAALLARDARFDGQFFVAVRSTGIYCRPVCRVRSPRPENCRYYRHAAAAEAAGFRPCLRCRPELAPGLAALDMPSQLAWAAARRIEAGELDDGDLPQLAARLGITDRHLRRVFQATWGVSPIDYAQTQRLLHAKRLLADTDLPIGEVALAAGFGSLRRFNDLFRQRYRLAPQDLRKRRDRAARDVEVDTPHDGPHDGPRDTPGRWSFELAWRPPCDWSGWLDDQALRAVPGLEWLDGERPALAAGDRRVYARTLRLTARGGEHLGWIALQRAAPDREALRLTLSPSLAGALPQALAAARRLADLGGDPRAVAAVLGDLCAAAPGLRLPGAADPFEMAVRAVLGQQVSVAAARTVASRLARAFGDAIETPWPALDRVFPSAQRLAACTLDDIAGLGIVAQRARAVLALAQAVADERISLAPSADLAATLAALQALPGIGAWTAQTIALQALGWPDAWPSGDRVLLQALAQRGDLQPEDPARFSPRDVRAADARAEAWRPWRGYATLHLWRQALASRSAPPSEPTASPDAQDTR
ncbi:Ada metal-binding domain-containing protein [Sphaerotilus mobilis]|uniref:DNA-3-methyladenine glycosylase II n=1 Tax=Sphaerotilus mobilis TaxID=47994 RepID=A0A4Q7LFL7_9BURK|nr:Ada metal-binding domain-containing protein [Sphaerotilus mobilis]RZS52118.1 DNA-3-methyladenine glycosylase II [Sphaerotilus mobilis]